MLSIFRNRQVVAAVSNEARRYFSDSRTQEPNNFTKLFVVASTFGSGFVLGAYNSDLVMNAVLGLKKWSKDHRVTMQEVEKIEYGYTLDDESDKDPEEKPANGM